MQRLRNAFGKKIRSYAKDLKNRIEFIALSLVEKWDFLVYLYYFVWSNAFHREMLAVMHGRVSYLKKVREDGYSQYLLRRNIHRLEKGLLMRPRKPVFGLEYLSDTVKCYEQATKNINNANKDEVLWGYDILRTYFEAVGMHEIVERNKVIFQSISKPEIDLMDCSKYPYLYKKDPTLSVSYNDFYKLATNRKSVRWYKDEPVPRELIDKALLIATMAPSSCNRQPYEFRIFDDRELTPQVAKLAWGTVGFYQNIPTIIVMIGKMDAFFNERDRHLIYIDGSLACMSFILALETLGLSSCMLNWPDLKKAEKKMADLLHLSSDERPVVLIAVGYADPEGMVAFSQKKTLDQIRKYNYLS